MAGTIDSAAPQTKAQAESPVHAVPWAIVREIGAVLLLVALADVTIYRGAGFAGLALALVAGPIFLLLGSSRPSLKASFWLVVAMILLLAARMIWLGSALAVAVGAILIIAYSVTLQGRRPYVFDLLLGTFQLSIAGGFGLDYYRRCLAGRGPRVSRLLWLSVLLPLGGLAAFGTLFVLANPDLANSIADQATRIYERLVDWYTGMSENWLELGF
ncbi:MAG TPA: hypothetical protein VFV87_10585, partial [Pirellulaceae bacterium]|nr:hypothetical protein [Pirellulaceae bacterium]